MRRLLTTAVLVLSLFAVGCAGMNGQTVTKDTMVECPKCGAEFHVHEGLPETP